RFRDRFPRVEEHPPLEPVFERFGVRGVPRGSIQVEMLRKPPVPRCWFVNEAGTELIQVQQDRFVHNWRKVIGSEAYPRYEHVRETFAKELGVFQQFLHDESLGELLPNQAEVTYVNHIVLGDGWSHHGELAKVLTLCGDSCTETFLPDPEEIRVSGSFVIPSREGKPVGRLRFSVEPTYRKVDDQALFLLKLVARGQPLGSGLLGVTEFLDLGREWIVRGFADLTTAEMHRIWRRKG
ncbi:unnamed protein product, partial [marine sediment metagenome]